MEAWLNSLLDLGLSEWQFWDMTLAEINRYAESRHRVQKKEAQEKAAADYVLADLIGHSIARIYSSEAKYPEIYDVYPAIFDKAVMEEAKEREKNKKTFEWLKEFTESFNKSNSKEGKDTR